MELTMNCLNPKEVSKSTFRLHIMDPASAVYKNVGHVAYHCFRSRQSRKVWLYGVGIYLAFKIVRRQLQVYGMKQKVKERRNRRQQQLDEYESKLASQDADVLQERHRIVELTLNELIEQLQSGALTAVQVLHAYQWNALAAQKDTNCLHGFVDEAEHWANDLDEQAANGKTKGPLFGVPISVKDCVPIKNYESPLGYAQNLGNFNKENAAIITFMQQLGAIPFCITNMPQSGFCFGSTNPIFGTTLNPHDKIRSPAGSSCGEGALIARHGSILGLGTDVGGSVRMPAHFCGITALKPCRSRVTNANMKGFMPGRPFVIASWGPMARDVDSLVTLMKNLIGPNMFDLDGYVIPKPFDLNYFEGSKPLTIGYYTNNGYLEAVPACVRAVHKARSVLEQRGHKLVPFEVPDPKKSISLYYGACLLDSGSYLSNNIFHDLPDGLHNRFWGMGQYKMRTKWRRWLACFPMSVFAPKLALVWKGFARDTCELRQTYEDIEKYRAQFIAQWQSAGIDCMICPPMPCTQLPHDMPPSMFPACSYCFLYNMLDYPAGVVPVTKVSESDEIALNTRYQCAEGLEIQIKRGSQGCEGLPVGVQCVALPFREEICLRLMKELETAVKETTNY